MRSMMRQRGFWPFTARNIRHRTMLQLGLFFLNDVKVLNRYMEMDDWCLKIIAAVSFKQFISHIYQPINTHGSYFQHLYLSMWYLFLRFKSWLPHAIPHSYTPHHYSILAQSSFGFLNKYISNNRLVLWCDKTIQPWVARVRWSMH